MAEDRKSLKFWQSMGNNSSITDDTQMKLHVHNTMVIYIQYKFHERTSDTLIGYLPIFQMLPNASLCITYHWYPFEEGA